MRENKGLSRMIHKTLSRIIFAVLVLMSSAFAVINDGSNDYVEKMLPVSGSGTTPEYYVVMGTGLTITANSTSNRNTITFTVNGTSYMNAGTVSIPASADDRYYIYHNGKKAESGFTISGTNDWTTQTYTVQTVPFTQSGSGSYFYSFAGSVDSVVTSNMDFFLINNVNYANQTVTTLPAKINNNYYFYYGTTNSSGSLQVKEYTPKLNLKVFMEGSIW